MDGEDAHCIVVVAEGGGLALALGVVAPGHAEKPRHRVGRGEAPGDAEQLAHVGQTQLGAGEPCPYWPQLELVECEREELLGRRARGERAQPQHHVLHLRHAHAIMWIGDACRIPAPHAPQRRAATQLDETLVEHAARGATEDLGCSERRVVEREQLEDRPDVADLLGPIEARAAHHDGDAVRRENGGARIDGGVDPCEDREVAVVQGPTGGAFVVHPAGDLSRNRVGLALVVLAAILDPTHGAACTLHVAHDSTGRHA